MDIEQRYEVLRQIARDYGLLSHMTANRDMYERRLGLSGMETGHDIALVEMLVHGEGLYPVNYEIAMWRACKRLGIPVEAEG